MSVRLAPGSTFAGYKIEEEIGRGGMGVVYRATDLSLERPVALKLIAPELAEDPAFRERFLRESRLAASLGHPHILPVHAAGEVDGRLFIAMRYVEGQDLKGLLRDEPLAPERALAVCSQVAEALDAAHRRGLVHRDVKPGNVLLDEEGQAYLTDFGLAKELTRDSAATATGTLVGTLDYLAPEQIRGEELDGRADQYALACVLCECLSGTPPFRGQTEAEVLWAHMQADPPLLEEFPQLDRVLARGLAKDKAGRFATCTELIDSAREALGIETPRARRQRRLIRRSRLLVVAGLLVIGVGGAPSDIVAELDGAWVSDALAGSATLIEPERLTAVRTVRTRRKPLPLGGLGRPAPGAGQLAIGFGSLWLAAGDNTIARIDLRTHRVVARIPGIFTEASLGGIAIGDGSVWVAGPYENNPLTRIDPRTNKVVATIPLQQYRSNGIAFGGGAVWVSDEANNQVWEVDPVTNAAAGSTKVGGQPLGVAYGAGSIWVANSGDGTVSRIDPTSGRVTRTIRVTAFGSPNGIAATRDGIWVTVG